MRVNDFLMWFLKNVSTVKKLLNDIWYSKYAAFTQKWDQEYELGQF